MTTPAIPLLTVPEAAAELRVSIATMYRLLAARQIRPTRVGGRQRIRRSELDRYIERQTAGAER